LSTITRKNGIREQKKVISFNTLIITCYDKRKKRILKKVWVLSNKKLSKLKDFAHNEGVSEKIALQFKSWYNIRQTLANINVTTFYEIN